VVQLNVARTLTFRARHSLHPLLGFPWYPIAWLAKLSLARPLQILKVVTLPAHQNIIAGSYIPSNQSSLTLSTSVMMVEVRVRSKVGRSLHVLAKSSGLKREIEPVF
jgi:hypothetical protein